MKLTESLIYASILFLGLYALIAVGLRIFELTSVFYAHVIAGLIGTVSGVLLFIYLLIRKKKTA